MPKATPSAQAKVDLVGGEALRVLMTQPTELLGEDSSGIDSEPDCVQMVQIVVEDPLVHPKIKSSLPVALLDEW